MDAPKITPEHIDSIIVKADYILHPGSQLTICLLTLANGFVVTGESACASPENFDQKEGEKYALIAAKSKIWQLEGYLLKQALYQLHTPTEEGLKVGKVAALTSRLRKLQGLARWMSGCAYDFNKHNFYKQRKHLITDEVE